MSLVATSASLDHGILTVWATSRFTLLIRGLSHSVPVWANEDWAANIVATTISPLIFFMKYYYFMKM